MKPETRFVAFPCPPEGWPKFRMVGTGHRLANHWQIQLAIEGNGQIIAIRHEQGTHGGELTPGIRSAISLEPKKSALSS